jgi:signal transduction histidine kinase
MQRIHSRKLSSPNAVVAAAGTIANAYPFQRQTALAPRSHRWSDGLIGPAAIPLAPLEDDVTDHLTLVASGRAPLPSAQGAHDIRNLLATIGLHVDTLARLSGPRGVKAAHAAHGLIARAGDMCGQVFAARDGEGRSRRHPFDIMGTIREVVDLLDPLGPEGFVIAVAGDGNHFVLGDDSEVFRVLFNILHNGVAIACARARLRRIEISVEQTGATTTVRIADDGEGLPPPLVARLFRAPEKAGSLNGHGLAIARELAERNGGMLTCKTSRRGTTFHLRLAAFTAIKTAEGPVTRSLGRRASF